MPMRDLQADPPLLTDEELNALMSEDAPVTYDTDVWFKYRNLFLLVTVISQVIKLLFFSHLAIGNFELGTLDPVAFKHYLAFRACFVIAISYFYLFSYLRDWHFEKVSVLYVGIDLPPTSRTKLRLVKSVKLEQDGHEEEQIYRRTDHWLSQAG